MAVAVVGNVVVMGVVVDWSVNQLLSQSDSQPGRQSDSCIAKSTNSYCCVATLAA